MKTFIITNTFFILCLLPAMSWAQFVTISGFINNSSNGKALENVSIFEANSGIGTITNQNGFYRLILSENQVKLKITNDGFKSIVKELEIKSDTTFVLSLEPKMYGKKNLRKVQLLHAGIDQNKKEVAKQKQE